MSSQVEICNLALNILGEAPITSLSDTVKGARVMSLLFTPSRDAVLRLHPWNFAVARAELAALVAAPAFGFDMAYALPADFLRLIDLNADTTRDSYQLERQSGQRVLLTDASSAQIRYIARVEDTAQFDPLFVQALAAFLAHEAATQITNSPTIEQRAATIFDEKMQEARSVDGMENYPDIFMGDYFLQARLGDDSQFRTFSASFSDGV